MSTDESTSIDVGAWFATLARNWWVIVGLVVIGIIVGAVVTIAQPKEYTATASVYIGQTTDATGNPMAGLNSNAKAAVQLLASQVVLKEAAERTFSPVVAWMLCTDSRNVGSICSRMPAPFGAMAFAVACVASLAI